jgi:hypothetical protein
MKLLKVFLIIILFSILTLFTQIGGVVLMLSMLTHKLTDKWASNKYLKSLYRFASFLILYCIATFLIVPLIAKPFGRVALPITETNHLKPLNILTCILNRNYVKKDLKQVAFDVAKQMNQKYPGTKINYLEANFPFIDGFKLFPHLSHDDGKKLDVAFCYIDANSKESTNECPSFIGYGICEEPKSGEINYTNLCEDQGYWQYGLLSKIISQENKKQFIFNQFKTKELVNLFAQQNAIGKIFIEPHLRNRLGLNSSKVRFHGCQAVRHDDHIHVQLK